MAGAARRRRPRPPGRLLRARGSSIRLIELTHALRTEFNVSVPVGLLFKVTTLHGMARTLEQVVTGRIEGAGRTSGSTGSSSGRCSASRRPAGTAWCTGSSRRTCRSTGWSPSTTSRGTTRSPATRT
ncbi:acyl carrier protein [Kitasatospora aburaviensis]